LLFLESDLKDSLLTSSADLLHAKFGQDGLDGRIHVLADVADCLGITLRLEEGEDIGGNALDKSSISLGVSKDIKVAFDGVGGVATHADTELDLASLLGDCAKEELLAEFSEEVVHTLLLSGLGLLAVGSASAPFLPDCLVFGGKRTDSAAVDIADILLRIWADGGDGDLLHRSLLWPEDDTSIDSTDATLTDKERVDINLLDKRMISSKITKGDKKRLKLLHIDRTLTTDTLKSLEDLSALHAGTSNRTSEGRKDESTILVNLHKFATSAEHDNRTKLRIAVGTEKNLKPFSISSIG